jgi:hypothetical protein
MTVVMNFKFGNASGEGAFPELTDGRVVHHVTSEIGLGTLEGGMGSGLPSVALKIDLPDGSSVLVETSARMFIQAAKLVQARCDAWGWTEDRLFA